MLAGHYSTAFAAKAAVPRVPLWALFLAAQCVDVLWAIFVLAGIEHVRFDLSLASNPLDLYDMPFTHSLAGSVVWASIAFALTQWWLSSAGAALAVAGTVVSHWFLDLLVHRPDLTLWGGEPKVGLALWNRPVVALVVELACLAAGVWLYVRRGVPAAARRRLYVVLGVLVAMQIAMTAAPPPGGTTLLAVSMLVVFLTMAAAGALIERRG